jgi:ribosomal protein S18 acetylase RimI-like enzyme
MRNIRRADPADAAALASLAERIFRDTFATANDPADVELHCARNFSSTVQLREITDPNLVTIVSERGDELIGFAQVRVASRIECVSAKHPTELCRFYVSHRWHGSGAGHELMNEVLDTVARLASDRLWLGVWERNDRAVRFYRKFGFAVVGDHTFVLGHDTQRDLVMAVDVERAAASCGDRRQSW